MPAFAYKGRNTRGELVSGSVDAANAKAAAIQLQNQAIVPVSIDEEIKQEHFAAVAAAIQYVDRVRQHLRPRNDSN